VVRYVERNASRAGLSARAEDWPWGSLAAPSQGQRLDVETLPRKADWIALVNAPTGEVEDEAIRLSIARDRPYGSAGWTTATASRLGLTSSLRPRGRPPSRSGAWLSFPKPLKKQECPFKSPAVRGEDRCETLAIVEG
jgi:hypothetical protein